MSIVNLSSENREPAFSKGGDADFVVAFKKPLQKIIGMQVLNATIPLTYRVINADDYQLHMQLGTLGAVVTKDITEGTYTKIDELCAAIGKSLRSNNATVNKKQRQIHIQNRRLVIKLTIDIFPKLINTDEVHYRDTIDRFPVDKLEPGMIVRKDTDLINSLYTVISSNDSDHNKFAAKRIGIDPSTGLAYPSTNQTLTETANDTHWALHIPEVLCFYEQNEQHIVIATQELNNIDFTHFKILPSTKDHPLRTSRRMMKTIGFTGGETYAAIPDGKYKHLNKILRGLHSPENQGPGLLFLRIMGDVILDQQNSETHMNDRIPIPLTGNHGDIVHYENDAEADVIPLGVPCDVRRLRIRLEYGDDNTPVGGYRQNLRGHHIYLRLKFFKQHQQHGKKM